MEPASETEPAKANMNYMPALDGLRGLCVLGLMASHGGLQNWVPGILSLLCFFVISSFLLTRQMIVEIEKTGTLNLKLFYLRRIFRLIPALLLFCAFFTLVLRHLGADITLVHIASALFYFANYYHIFYGYPAESPFPIVWSLSVEEHYYIIFPLCMLAFRRSLRKMLPWLLAVLVLALLWRLRLHSDCKAEPGWWLCGLPGSPRWKGTDVMFDCMLYGAGASLLLQYYTAQSRRFFITPLAFGLALAGLVMSIAIRNPDYRETYRYSLQSLCLTLIVINVLFGKWDLPRKILSGKLFVFVGQLSYSLYLFHYGMLVVAMALQPNQDEGLHGFASFILYVGGSFLLAMLSYYGVERPMIAVRRRFGSRRHDTVG